MNNRRLRALLFAFSFALPASAWALSWSSVEKIPPGALINVTATVAGVRDTTGKAQKTFVCAFQRATDDKLYCSMKYGGSDFRGSITELALDRSEIREVKQVGAYDYSGGMLNLIVGAEGGGGWVPGQSPDAFAGVKLGGDFTLDLQYDRIAGKRGFSVEGSGVLPVFRIPMYHPHSVFTLEGGPAHKDPLWFKVFAEPGVGYRAGDGPFGGYSSAKVLVLLGDKWRKDNGGGTTPYLEFQRRFPFGDPLHGDNRLAAGVMLAICGQCGLGAM